MLTLSQACKYANAYALFYDGNKRNNPHQRNRYETKLNAYDEMLIAGHGEDINLAYENKIHTDILSDIGEIFQRNNLFIEFWNNKEIIYEWSVNYTNTCIENNVNPSSFAVLKFLKRLKYTTVSSLGEILT